MKALILAGGRGKRLGDVSSGKNKCLLNVQGKPLIEYSLDAAINAGIEEIVVVVGYRADDIKNKYDNEFKGRRLKYVLQEDQRGLVHAIECSKNAIGDSDFMLLLGDEFMVNAKQKLMLKNFSKKNLFGICGIIEVEDKSLISKTYSIHEDGNNKILRLIEKPEHPVNNRMGTGNCIFKSEIFSYIDKTPINKKRNEREMPDLIQCAVDDGKRIETFLICDHYINVNSKEELKRIESYFSHF